MHLSSLSTGGPWVCQGCWRRGGPGAVPSPILQPVQHHEVGRLGVSWAVAHLQHQLPAGPDPAPPLGAPQLRARPGRWAQLPLRRPQCPLRPWLDRRLLVRVWLGLGARPSHLCRVRVLAAVGPRRDPRWPWLQRLQHRHLRADWGCAARPGVQAAGPPGAAQNRGSWGRPPRTAPSEFGEGDTLSAHLAVPDSAHQEGIKGVLVEWQWTAASMQKEQLVDTVTGWLTGDKFLKVPDKFKENLFPDQLGSGFCVRIFSMLQ
nr:uncharacterized protein LOC112427091 [Macaca nemestrina]